MCGTQGALGLFHLSAQLLDGTLVLGHVLPMLLLEDLHEVLHHTLIKILSSQVGVAIGGHHFEDSVVDGQQGHIEGATAKVVHQNVLLGLLIQAIGDGCSRGLVDDTKHIHASNGASVLGGLTLRIVEVGRNGHDGMFHFLAQVVFSGLLHLGEHHGGHFFRCHDLILTLHLDANHWLGAFVHNLIWQQLDVLLHRRVLEAPSDQTLHIEQGLSGIDGGLILGRLSDESFIICEGHVRRRDAIALVVGDDLYSAILVNADAGVSGAKIDANHRSIDLLLIFLCQAACREKGQ
mmetsp:Transcript_13398/g.16549  ORF Transcript_13398/g.16549 Transcript_13398/m.16549 type:complete len:292 (-) Transcript_13398:83-958(-)